MAKNKPGKDYIGVGGGVLILNKNKEMLLLKRGSTSKNEIGLWQKPGGALDFGEKAIAAMKREVFEETGLRIKIWGYLPHTDHIIKKDNQHWVAFNYLGDVSSGKAEIREKHKHSDIGWFAPDNLPKKINATTRESVRNYLAGKYIKL